MEIADGERRKNHQRQQKRENREEHFGDEGTVDPKELVREGEMPTARHLNELA